MTRADVRCCVDAHLKDKINLRCLSTVIQTYWYLFTFRVYIYNYTYNENAVRANFSTFLYFILLFCIVIHLRDDRHSQLVCMNKIVEIVSFDSMTFCL